MTDSDAVKLLDALNADTALGLLVYLNSLVEMLEDAPMPAVVCLPIVDVVRKNGEWYLQIDGGLMYAASTTKPTSVVKLSKAVPETKPSFSNN